jgi:hypothetical protein
MDCILQRLSLEGVIKRYGEQSSSFSLVAVRSLGRFVFRLLARIAKALAAGPAKFLT